MRAGEVARRAGVTVRALRYYEQAGLIVPARLPNGYRDYEPVAVRQVQQICELTRLGLSVQETRPFVECLAVGHDAGDECPASLAAYQRAIDLHSALIKRLTRRREALITQLQVAAARAVPSAARSTAPVSIPVSQVGAAPLGDEFKGRLVGARLPAVSLDATTGPAVGLATLGSGRTVLYVYPLTGRPDTDLPEGWENIPGARGCTAEACGFRDHHEELRRAGAARVYGLSAQPVDYQRELADRLRLPFAILSDPTLVLRDALKLPTLNADGAVLYRRLTMVIADGVIEHAFHPILTPGRHAGEVLNWLLSQPGQDR